MKKLSQVLALVFLIGLCFNVEISAQNTRYSTSNTASFQASPQKENAKLISSRSLKEGRNFVRMGSTKLQIVKSRGRVISINPISNTGQLGPNMLKANTETQAFTCFGPICICFGDDDCNDMFISNVCSRDSDDAACVDDVCMCNKN